MTEQAPTTIDNEAALQARLTLEQISEEQQSAHELAATTISQAIELMKEHGASYIRGFAPNEDCDYVTTELDTPLDGFGTTGWFGDLQQTDLVEGRQKAGITYKSTAIKEFKAKIVDSVRKDSKKQPEMREWANRTGEGKEAIPVIEVFKYKDGSSLIKHIDFDKGDFPTQALVNLRGTAIFDVFDALTDEQPKFSISLQKGDLIFLRGNEFGKLKQPPHAVRDIDGDRVVMTIYPDRDYESELRWLKSKEHNSGQRRQDLRTLAGIALQRIVRR